MSLNLIVQKLKREWKTFALSVTLTLTGAWELAATWGADLPSLFNWVPEQYKSGVLFAVGLAFLLLRKYTPTTVTNTTETETVETKTKDD